MPAGRPRKSAESSDPKQWPKMHLAKEAGKRGVKGASKLSVSKLREVYNELTGETLSDNTFDMLNNAKKIEWLRKKGMGKGQALSKQNGKQLSALWRGKATEAGPSKAVDPPAKPAGSARSVVEVPVKAEPPSPPPKPSQVKRKESTAPGPAPASKKKRDTSPPPKPPSPPPKPSQVKRGGSPNGKPSSKKKRTKPLSPAAKTAGAKRKPMDEAPPAKRMAPTLPVRPHMPIGTDRRPPKIPLTIPIENSASMGTQSSALTRPPSQQVMNPGMPAVSTEVMLLPSPVDVDMIDYEKEEPMSAVSSLPMGIPQGEALERMQERREAAVDRMRQAVGGAQPAPVMVDPMEDNMMWLDQLRAQRLNKRALAFGAPKDQTEMAAYTRTITPQFVTRRIDF